MKIRLPEKRKCGRCGGTGYLIPATDIDNPCDCEDGYRYDFDDLAAAVREAGLFYTSQSPYPNEHYTETKVEIITHPALRRWSGAIAIEEGDTAALLAAITKHNEEERE